LYDRDCGRGLRDRASDQAGRAQRFEGIACVERKLHALQTHLRKLLSGYKLPRSVAYVDEIPRTATGKANYPAAKDIAEATHRGAVADAH
jgi:acyl-CoA synthetase (AMP-forming)/AMP-acid ligase II